MIAGKKIAILVDNYFEQAEFERPLHTLEEAGANVVVIGTHTKTLQAMNHTQQGGTFQASLLLEEAVPEEYNALVLPGGVINADTLRMEKKAQQWVNEFIDSGKLIAAICHAPWLLVSADVVEERHLTSYYTLRDDIRNAGGEWTNQAVVIDSNLITSRTPDDLDQFTGAIKKWFEQTDT